ncbi:MAG: methyl-accepting chemotaxis protein [Bacteroidales bacterium]|nr:methyl-accepting chemotaxis protein [Bacteroidales bacterium]
MSEMVGQVSEMVEQVSKMVEQGSEMVEQVSEMVAQVSEMVGQVSEMVGQVSEETYPVLLAIFKYKTENDKKRMGEYLKHSPIQSFTHSIIHSLTILL